MSSIYVCQDSQDWILKILGEDILKGFEKLGWTCHSGRYAGYDGEDVALHMWWRTAQPYKAAPATRSSLPIPTICTRRTTWCG